MQKLSWYYVTGSLSRLEVRSIFEKIVPKGMFDEILEFYHRHNLVKSFAYFYALKCTKTWMPFSQTCTRNNHSISFYITCAALDRTCLIIGSTQLTISKKATFPIWLSLIWVKNIKFKLTHFEFLLAKINNCSHFGFDLTEKNNLK